LYFSFVFSGKKKYFKKPLTERHFLKLRIGQYSFSKNTIFRADLDLQDYLRKSTPEER
jgi:hypothetical protein